MKEESNIEIRDFMLAYVSNLLEDDTDLLWAAAKHAMLLCRLDQGKIKDWADVDRMAHAQRHVDQHMQIQKVMRKITLLMLHLSHVCTTCEYCLSDANS